MPENIAATEALVARHLAQLSEEGVDISQFRAEMEAAQRVPESERAATLRRLSDQLDSLAVLSTEDEPSDWESIRASLPQAVPGYPIAPEPGRLSSQILGGWLGRCAGCLLGKPLEGAMDRHKDGIAQYLREAGAYPLNDYVPVTDALAARYRFHRSYKVSTRGNIHGMPRDDDIDYVLLNLLLLEECGPDFGWAEATEVWMRRLSYHTIFAAGRAAYRNMVNGLLPPETAQVNNPYRQSLGGQIRADTFGYISPGDPARAAELAFRDSAMSQTRNGIYSGMFFAALIGAAFGAPDVASAVDAALAQIPIKSALATAIGELLRWVDIDGDWQRTLDRIYDAYGHQSFNYSIINAVLALLGPLYAPDNYGQATAITVMGGFDTDCTGATAGSLMGVLLGADGIPDSWTAPLENRYHSYIVGIGEIAISELARRTEALVQA